MLAGLAAEGVHDLGLPVGSYRPLARERRHRTRVTEILAVRFPLGRREVHLLAKSGHGVPEAVQVKVWQSHTFERLLENADMRRRTATSDLPL
jgi:hypothetical protein